MVSLVVHEVNTMAHPSVPPGWRWCVHYGGQDWADTRTMLNAGWSATRMEAMMTGEAVHAAVLRALSMAGVNSLAGALVGLEYDPIPAGRDLVRVG